MLVEKKIFFNNSKKGVWEGLQSHKTYYLCSVMLKMSKTKKIFILNFVLWVYTEQRQCGGTNLGKTCCQHKIIDLNCNGKRLLECSDSYLNEDR